MFVIRFDKVKTTELERCVLNHRSMLERAHKWCLSVWSCRMIKRIYNYARRSKAKGERLMKRPEKGWSDSVKSQRPTHPRVQKACVGQSLSDTF